MRNGWNFNTLSRRSFVASTTMSMFLFISFSMICSYMSDGSEAGMVPASTKQSPDWSLSSLSNICCSSSFLMSGPCPLISVSCSALILTFILLRPFFNWIKSVLTPMALTPSSISLPVNPATKPRATESTPMFLSTVETLIPLPP